MNPAMSLSATRAPTLKEIMQHGHRVKSVIYRQEKEKELAQ